MSSNSSIEWTDASWTPIRARPRSGEKLVGDPGWKSARPGGRSGWYCEHISDGCSNCYAEAMNRRLGTGIDFKRQNRERVEIFLDEEMLLAPLRWKKPRMIFVCSMTDLFAEFVKDEWIDKIFAVMALCPHHTFQVLTKRAERMRGYFRKERVALTRRWGDAAFAGGFLTSVCGGEVSPDARQNNHAIFEALTARGSKLYQDSPLGGWPLPNVWLGTSCERQQEADERIPLLRETPAAVRFISFEPLLGHIAPDLRGIHWAIAGGESGPDARPMHPKWPRRLRNVCAEQGVAFFFKQWGQWAPYDAHPGGDLGGEVRSGRVRIVHPTAQSDVEVAIATGGYSTVPGSRYMERVGKKSAGRLLDGREHNEFPASTLLSSTSKEKGKPDRSRPLMA